jgi:hypothetical protein
LTSSDEEVLLVADLICLHRSPFDPQSRHVIGPDPEGRLRREIR